MPADRVRARPKPPISRPPRTSSRYTLKSGRASVIAAEGNFSSMARTAPFGAITAFRAVTVFERSFTALKTWNVTRQTEDQLSKLSDRELDDIGLHRGWIGDVAGAYARR